MQPPPEFISVLSSSIISDGFGPTSAPSPMASAIASLAPTVAAIGILTINPTPAPLIATLSATAAAASATVATGRPQDGEGSGECKLLGSFALLVQGALGLLALSSLVWKRYRERPQRPLKIWAFDASKQVVGSALLHIANLIMSMFSSGQFSAVQLKVTPASQDAYQPNPCSFYLLNLAIDTTIGIPILVILLRLLTYGFSLTPFGKPIESIQSGHYGHPPKAKWWAKQSFIYFLGLLGMKACVFFIFQILPWISLVGDWALRWTEGNETLQIFFVMLFFPVIMNALQYYIIDSFIKGKPEGEHEPIPSEEGDSDDDEEERTGRPSIEDSTEPVGSAQGGAEAAMAKEAAALKENRSSRTPPDPKRVTKLKIDSKKLDEYNPDTDGEESPTVVGSGSNDEGEHLLPGSKDKRRGSKFKENLKDGE
ncbi:MAG: hypothetical protein M1812_002821 [Candelaria pacifica]|nr:MAG: hypothetical protein M1812_002821 [Candelaria pacifica]